MNPVYRNEATLNRLHQLLNPLADNTMECAYNLDGGEFESGTVTFTYDAFGNVVSRDTDFAALEDGADEPVVFGPPGTCAASEDAAFIGRYYFDGMDLEIDEKLYYSNEVRHYDPSIGRWLDPEPMGFSAGDSNLYRYLHPQQP